MEQAAEIVVLEFKIERLRDANNNPYINAYAVIDDKRTGETVTLKNGEQLYLDDFVAELVSDSDATQLIQLNQIKQKFETLDGKYRLESVDYEQESVTVFKYASDANDAQVLTIMLDTTSEEGKEASTSKSLDSLFN